MNRFFALLGALLLAFISVSSACTAAPVGLLHFTLEPDHGNDGIKASFRNENRPNHDNNWSTGFRPSELVGLDLAGFRGAGSRPLRFSVIREAGRLDCSGHGGESYAAGDCNFTRDPAFAQLLRDRGIGNPTDEQALGLMAVNARRDIIDGVAAARYPTPTINDLMGLSALGVDGSYIRNMAAAGYRPGTIDALIQFKALNITPAWIGGFARIGYASLPADELVQLKALDITPEFIAGFDRLGYGHLKVDELVQLKALNITPDFVQRVAAADSSLPPVNKLVELKTFGRKR
ncbi:MAG TPA: hypothetical protein VHS33_01200 [Sphingomicrobium sp.]|jgi:hypothetical protein|nr:hypothetical protein [Sphingomicrobium sp.]